jgi:hypothetical protein
MDRTNLHTLTYRYVDVGTYELSHTHLPGDNCVAAHTCRKAGMF